MPRKQRLKVLVASCFAVFFGLVAIQLYMLRNTFLLNVANYRFSVKAAAIKLQADSTYNVTLSNLQLNLVSCAEKLASGEINQAQFLNQLKDSDEKVMMKLDSIIRIRAKTNILLKDVNELSTYTSIIITKPGGRFIPVTTSAPLRLGTLSMDTDKTLIELGEGLGVSERGENDELQIRFLYKRNLQIPTLPHSILLQFLTIGGLAVVLLTAVVSLFFVVISSAQKQTKLAELRANLVNNISHQLKTPLSSMAVALKTLKFPGIEANTIKSKELLTVIERQHTKLNRTVERVLESSVQNNFIKLEEFDISKFLNQYQNDLLINTHSVFMSIEPNQCVVTGVRGIVESAIDNLLENAQKYSPPNTNIYLEGKIDNTMYRIDIIDSGQGIAKEYQKRLFEKFYRGSEKNQHTVKGLGLGLYLSRKELRSIGGNLELTSSNDTGSRFTIYLLLA